MPSGTTRTLDEVKNHIDVRGPLHIKIDTLSALRVGMFNTAVSAADGTFTPSDSLIEFGGPMSIGALGVAQTFRAQHEVDASSTTSTPINIFQVPGRFMTIPKLQPELDLTIPT